VLRFWFLLRNSAKASGAKFANWPLEVDISHHHGVDSNRESRQSFVDEDLMFARN